MRVAASRAAGASRRSARGVYILPNLFTTGGLFAGLLLDHLHASTARYRIAAIMILVAQLCDVLDGRIARLTRSTSSFGVEYDSLADLIAFGVAPGILVYKWALEPWGRWGWLAASLYVACGALRLARFNVQVGSVEKRHFIGLPDPRRRRRRSPRRCCCSTTSAARGPRHKHIIMLLVIYGRRRRSW